MRSPPAGLEDFDQVYAVNVKGVYNCLRACIPSMRSNGGGVILNLASIAASVGLPDRFAYSMSKGAVVSMTLSVAKDYLSDPKGVELLPGICEALDQALKLGYHLFLFTNQSGVGRGMIEESFVEEVHQIIQSRLVDIGEKLDGHYYCPHEPSASIEAFRFDCDCRKPKPGLVTRAARDLGLDVERSIVVGDKWSDICLAKQAGARGVLVRTCLLYTSDAADE